MEWIDQILTALFALLLGGGGTATYYQTKKVSRQQANDETMLNFYALWNEELKRLRREIDTLHALVGALESEIIVLGGDPVRIRLDVSRQRSENDNR